MSQFPYDGLRWKSNLSQPAIHSADRAWFYSCYGSGSTLMHLGASGYQEIGYSATAQGVQGVDGADQVLFFFPSTSAAEQALGTIHRDYAHCPEQTRGTDGAAITGAVWQAAALDGGYAWDHVYQTVSGGEAKPANVPSTNHEFFVQRGDVVEMVRFGGEGSLANQVEDVRFLNSLITGLCVYGGPCAG